MRKDGVLAFKGFLKMQSSLKLPFHCIIWFKGDLSLPLNLKEDPKSIRIYTKFDYHGGAL